MVRGPTVVSVALENIVSVGSARSGRKQYAAHDSLLPTEICAQRLFCGGEGGFLFDPMSGALTGEDLALAVGGGKGAGTWCCSECQAVVGEKGLLIGRDSKTAGRPVVCFSLV